MKTGKTERGKLRIKQKIRKKIATKVTKQWKVNKVVRTKQVKEIKSEFRSKK